MEQWEFQELTERIIEPFRSRVPSEYATGLGAEIEGGEYRYALENLIYILVDATPPTPVTTEEREALYRLVRHLKKNEALLAKLDGLVAAEDSAEQ